MKQFLSVIMIVMILLTSSVCAESATSQLREMYAEAELLMATGDYSGAAAKFDAMGAYSDASQMAMYCKAIVAAETLGMYNVAISAFEDLGDFKDCKQMATYYTARKYQAAGDSIDISTTFDSDLELARFSYEKGAEIYAGLALFKDCLTRMNECQSQSKIVEEEQKAREETRKESSYQEALALEEKGDYQQAIDIFKLIQGYKDSKAHITACENAVKEGIYQEGLALEEKGDYQAAIDKFKTVKGYKDSEAHITACENEIIYQEGLALEKKQDFRGAVKKYRQIIEYKDSSVRIEHCIEEAHKIYRIVSEHYESYNAKQVVDLKSVPRNSWVAGTEYTITYTYYKASSQIQITKSDLPEKEIITLDEEGNKKYGTKEGNWSSGKYTFTAKITYDSHGNPIRVEKTYRSPDNWLYQDGTKQVYTYTYTYDEYGNIIRSIGYLDGKKMEYDSFRYEYVYDGSRVIQYLEIRDDGGKWIHYLEYDELGFLIRESYESAKKSADKLNTYAFIDYTYEKIE